MKGAFISYVFYCIRDEWTYILFKPVFFLKYANIPNCVVGFGTSNGILKLKKKKRKYNSGIAEAVE